MEEAASEVHVTVQTIYDNARVADVVDAYEQSSGNTTLPITINKTDVVESLNAPEPVAALAMIVEKKAADPDYTTRQAREAETQQSPDGRRRRALSHIWGVDAACLQLSDDVATICNAQVETTVFAGRLSIPLELILAVAAPSETRSH